MQYLKVLTASDIPEGVRHTVEEQLTDGELVAIVDPNARIPTLTFDNALALRLTGERNGSFVHGTHCNGFAFQQSELNHLNLVISSGLSE